MPTVHFIDVNGERISVEGTLGSSVMETATQNGVDGIVGQCGGSLACASCHVYVNEEWIDLTGTAVDFEADMLEGALAEVLPTSRLSCQLILADSLDGLVVRVAPEQL